ncbi:ferrochelatase [Hydrogenimonas cancrithermarum]|uniref:Ferrochelatase n=2 Tax=Hydrogenimonas cancrithermarum TaxID=2993563 RepID=A0ABN6WST7_9BACT|nr:ferrochelatase [Hydrogenimonas cancrithermarum]
MNMGGASNQAEIEVFMKNMFNDRRIIGAPPFVRKNLADYITATRLGEVKENYEKIGGGSPLLAITERLKEKLQARIDDAKVEIIMRYTPPFAQDILRRLKAEGVEKLYLIPMYPQFSTTTTASSIEDIRTAAKKIGYHPTMVSTLHYYDFEPYLESVEEKIIETLGGEDPKSLNLVFSAHGLPVRVIKRGDPYKKQVEAEVKKHVERLREKGIVFNQVHLAYQSKVGPLKWLTPSLERMLEEIKNKRVLIYPISFTIDNSETLFELDIEYKEVADKLKFETYKVCRCPNDSETFVRALELLYRRMV